MKEGRVPLDLYLRGATPMRGIAEHSTNAWNADDAHGGPGRRLPPRGPRTCPPTTGAVLTALGKKGDFKDGVLKVNIPRERHSASPSPGGRAPTPFGFGGWVALHARATGGSEVMMGDLVLTEDEVNPVMSAAARQRARRHRPAQPLLLGRAPHLLHARARHGARPDLARRVRPASDHRSTRRRERARPRRPRRAPGIARSGRRTSRAGGRSSAMPANRTAPSTRSRSGGRTSTCASTARSINARMGLNTWAAFAGTDGDAHGGG